MSAQVRAQLLALRAGLVAHIAQVDACLAALTPPPVVACTHDDREVLTMGGAWRCACGAMGRDASALTGPSGQGATPAGMSAAATADGVPAGERA